MNGKKVWFAASLAALVVVVMFSLMTVQPTQAATKELKIGALVNLKSPQGIEMQRWFNLFAKMYNEKGGWDIGGQKYILKPMIYDCGMMDVSKSRSAAERAVLQDGVKLIVATWGDVTEEVLTVTEPNKALWMGVSFTNDTVTPNFKYVVRGMGLFFGQRIGIRISPVKNGTTQSQPDCPQPNPSEKIPSS